MPSRTAFAVVLVSSLFGCGGVVEDDDAAAPPGVVGLAEPASFFVQDACMGLPCEGVDGVMLGTFVPGSFLGLAKDPPYTVRSSDPAVFEATTTSWRPNAGDTSALSFRITTRAVGEARLEVVGGSGRVEGWQQISVRMPDAVEPLLRVATRTESGGTLAAAPRAPDGAWEVRVGDEVHVLATARFQGRRLVQGTGMEVSVPDSGVLGPAGREKVVPPQAGTPVLVGRSPGEAQLTAKVGGTVQGAAIVRVR